MSKIKVRELARRLTSMGYSEMTPGGVVALAEAAGVPVGVSGSLDSSQVFVLLGQTDLPRRELVPQLMSEEWPPPQPRPRRITTVAPIQITPPRPAPAMRPARPPRPRGNELGPIGFPVSEASRQAAAAARPAPPPMRPFTWPAAQPPGRRRRERPAGPRPSVKVAGLGPMVQAILPLELRGRQWIWPAEAERWNEQATRWARAGFTDRSVRAWLETDLQPEDAGYLAARGVTAEALNKLVPVPVTVVATGAATVRLLLTSGRLPVAAVYDALVQAGHYVPAPEPELVLTPPARPVTDRPAAPPVVFSSPGDVDDPEPPVAPSRRRRTAKAKQYGRHNGPGLSGGPQDRQKWR
ncbi:hypothetical protein [Paractinoplanes atraurantiacus]|uniref:Uncharacterized protein n=1 Tax=Paractinoplanes atraurantiacus TaxID=1036182 RepID=A0A285KJY2_9ACTN|nr:hypothetical protein [Actinoplanes atraurantiacus]SNY72905.1 hypothetical protein SAMN05421748_14451 [Actinoplanes atraurantiacus]